MSCTLQVANLFVKGSSSVVGLLCGGFDMSSAVQLVVKVTNKISACLLLVYCLAQSALFDL